MKKKDIKKSRKQIKPPFRSDEEFYYYCICVNYCNAMYPENFDDAITCRDSNEWKGAMKRGT